MKFTKKIVSVLFVAVILATSLIIPASAASFSGGKGTKNNPYIVTTADQFNSIRDNLSAHYKLGANIDLSKFSNWKPIGTWKKAFTGSLTCDTDSSGKPVYAISNVTCTVTPVQPDGKRYDDPDYRYQDFKEDGSSGWEAGLFGVVNKATISNVIVLNVKITNHARGRSQQEMYKGQVANNPVWQMCAGGFAGTILSSKVTNCGVTGLVTGTSNHMGGFAGTIGGSSTVKQCYAIVDVKGGGEWFTGGFFGTSTVEKPDIKLMSVTGIPTITECYSEGWASGSWCNTGGFVGGMEKGTAKIDNCYNKGTTDDPSSGRSFFGQDNVGGTGTTKGCEADITNCYTLAGLAGKGKASTSKGKPDCFVGIEKDAKGNYPFQNGFTAANMATINNAFKNNPLWVVTNGSYPTLKNVHIIKSLNELGKPTATETPTPDTGDNTPGTDEPDANAPTETPAGSGNVNVNAYDNTAEMTTAELVLVIVLLVLIFITFVGSVVTIVLLLVFINKNRKTAA